MLHRRLVYLFICTAALTASCARLSDVIEDVAEACERPTIRVTTTDDLRESCTAETCSLWGAINVANVCNSGMVVELQDTRYTVSRQTTASPMPPAETIFSLISGRFTIDGNGAEIIRQPESEGARFFVLREPADMTLKDVTLSGGGTTYDEDSEDWGTPPISAGAIANFATLRLESASLTANRAINNGGAITNHGLLVIRGGAHARNISGGGCEPGGGGFLKNRPFATAVISNATFLENGSSCGGAIHNEGVMTVIDSTFLANQAGIGHDETYYHGGGIHNGNENGHGPSMATATIIGSTFSANTAVIGAAITNGNTSAMVLNNSTVSGNIALSPCIDRSCSDDSPDSHGMAGIASSGRLLIRDTTITANRCNGNFGVCTGGLSGPGSGSPASLLSIRNSIVAMNDGADCRASGSFVAGDVNLDSDSTCPGFSLHANPDLEALGFNGGPAPTHPVRAGSPPHDAGGSACFEEDQRNEPRERTSENPCDLGAFELQ